MNEPPATAAQQATTARLFIALWPGSETRQALASCRDRFDWPATARPVATANLHLTLHFLGSLAVERITALVDALHVPPVGFDLCLDRIDCWPGGVTVLRPLRMPSALRRLHADLAACLEQAGVPAETRRYRPHVTLARRSIGCQPLALAAPIDWQVDGHALLRSFGDGSYRVLRSFGGSAHRDVQVQDTAPEP